MKGEVPNKSLRAQSAWLLFAKLVGFVFSFLLPLLVVRILTKAEYGVYQQSFKILIAAVGLLPLGMTMSAFYYLSRDKSKRGAAILNIFLFNFVIGFLTFLYFYLFPQTIGNLMTSEEMTELSPLIGLAIWIWLFSMFLEMVAVANKESKLSTIFIIFSQLSKSVFMLSAVLMFGTVRALLWGAIIQGAVQTVILLWYVIDRFPKFWKSFSFKFFKEQLVYAIPLGFAGVLWMLQTEIHFFFVSYRFSDAEFAIYAVGCFQLPLVTILAESVISVLIPRMTELKFKNDTKEIVRITLRSMQTLALMFFPIYVYLFVNAELFITTLFTKKFESSVPIFRIFLTLLPFHIFLSDPLFRVFEKLGKYLVLFRTASGIVLIAWLFYGIHHYGLVGMISIVIVVTISEMVIAEVFVFRKVGVTLRDLKPMISVVKTGISAVFAGLVMYLIGGLIGLSILNFISNMLHSIIPGLKIGIVNFLSGSFVLGIHLLVFLAVYLPLIVWLSAIGNSDKLLAKNFFMGFYRKIFGVEKSLA